jgi:hypothetical protein
MATRCITMVNRDTVRRTKETDKIIQELMEKHPQAYPTKSMVYRAGIITLKRWRKLQTKQ